jgi:large subunit ribosomal protein L17
MRHQKKTVKLGRTAEHRKALLANQVCSLIEHSRIKTTLAKAKAVRPFAEKMLTLGKRGTLHDRRNAISYLHQPGLVKKLFEEIAPRSANRAGGYTRIIKLGPRLSDSAPMAYIEWVDTAPVADDLAPKEVKPAAKPEAKTAPETETDAAPAEKSGGAKRKRVTGSRTAAEKAKRALSKPRKQTAASQQTKPKIGGARLKNKRGRS